MLRFAPSPTGDMHIGNLRVAIINYIVSRQYNEPFLLRIEDTDRMRNIAGKDTEIMLLLEKFALKHDQFFFQSEHQAIHQKLAYTLLKEEKAFICTCTPEEIEKDRESAKAAKRPYRYSGKCIDKPLKDPRRLQAEGVPFVIRIKKPQKPVTFNDIVKGKTITEPFEIDHFIILRADGTPTYNFACACDDMLSDISTVIRGEDHLSNTPKQIHIHASLNYHDSPRYAHLPIILNEEGKKMSKRDQASSVLWLLSQGYLPDAIGNYLLLLGNSHAPTEIFTIQEAMKWFDLEKISKSPAKFDIQKLRYINREHIKNADDKELSRFFGFADEKIGKLAKLYLEEASTLGEIEPKIRAIFSPKTLSEEWKDEMASIRDILMEAPVFDDFDELKAYITHQAGLKGKRLFKPLRLLLTGHEHGPELGDLYPLIKPYLLEVIR